MGCWVAVLFLVLAAIAALQACFDSSPEPPSIVLITFDTIRADHLGCYGYFRDTTPRIDSLATESTLFEQCLAPMATTLPSHTSLFTGTYPNEHGILANIKHGGLSFESSAALRPLAEFARQTGYRTAAFVSAAPVKRETGMARGFEIFDEPEEKSRTAAETNKPLFAWFDKKGDEPYFLWVHYFDTHSPYLPLPPFDGMYATDSSLTAFLAEREIPGSAVGMAKRARPTREIHNRYDGEVSYVDRQIGLLLDRLRRSGDWERTVVVLVGDHGEGLAQHGELGHGSIWGEQLRVPLIVRVPGVAARREPVVMSIVDVVPTLLGLVPSLPFGGFLEQASGIDVLCGTVKNRFVFSRDSARERDDRLGQRCALTGTKWKYVYDPNGTDKLFDLSFDPFELNDLSGVEKTTAARLKALLLKEIGEQAGRGEILSGAAGRKAVPMDPALLEELRQLGY
jgi:arylsulfatase A-like enzyme